MSIIGNIARITDSKRVRIRETPELIFSLLAYREAMEAHLARMFGWLIRLTG